MKRLNESVQDCILGWVQKLSKHFAVELSEDQIEIFAHALNGCTVYQVNEAFQRCLNECEFMPKLAQVHQRMPEQRYAPENSGKFILNSPPVLDLVRAIAKELHPDYDTITDPKRIQEICTAANRERYRRMGVDPDTWRRK